VNSALIVKKKLGIEFLENMENLQKTGKRLRRIKKNSNMVFRLSEKKNRKAKNKDILN